MSEGPIFQRVALIGLGLIAGSMSLAMREGGLAARVVGYARSAETRDTAREIGLVDEVVDSAAEAVAGADLVVLAVPVGAMGAVAAEIAPHLAPGAILTDVGSVKQSVIDAVGPHVPEGVHFIPGHPLAGTEHSGPRSGFASLFQNRWWLFTPTEAAIVAIFYTLFVGIVIYREIDLRAIFNALEATTWLTGRVLLVLFTATIFGRILVENQIPAHLADGLLSLTTSKVAIWAIIIAFLLIVGMFMETLAAIMILVPVMLPVAYSVGIDPIHFGIVMICTLSVGFQTPPLGENLFIASGISGESIERISVAALPFAVASTVAHDSHHMIVVGTCGENMAAASGRLAELGGGITVFRDGAELAHVALPIAGLMSDRPAAEVAEAAEAVNRAIRDCGCTLNNAIMQHVLLALVVIPELRISDLGLVDVTRFEICDVVMASR